MQAAWFSVALEELAQMCGAFLKATTSTSVSSVSHVLPEMPDLRINVQVGDALNFCDALLAASPPPELIGGGGDQTANSAAFSETVFPPVSFQQATLQPLQLRAEMATGPRPEFDVINTSNLAEHLGEL